MSIGDLIKEYRSKNKYSMRDFATKCGVSHSYIAMLESEKNSKTGEPIIPSLTALNKIARGLGIPLNELLLTCEDVPITLSEFSQNEFAPTEPKLSEGEEKLLSLFRRLPPEAQEAYTNKLEESLKTLGLI